MSSYNAPVEKKPKFSVAISTPTYQNLIRNTLADPERAKRFIASITSAVAVNPQLQECETSTIVAGALLGESLNLSPSPQLGQFYLVPFKQKAKYDRNRNLISPECVNAQFVLGYKGYIQLAVRSGMYRKIIVHEIKDGELIRWDPLMEEFEASFIENEEKRDKTDTIGYYAMFEYVDGFRKTLYWSKDKMLVYADKYSPAFSKDAYAKLINNEIPANEMWKYSSLWYKSFDDMAKKTMIRQLISKWGGMAVEPLRVALEHDNNVLQRSSDGFENIATEADVMLAEPHLVSNNEVTQPEVADVVENINLEDL